MKKTALKIKCTLVVVVLMLASNAFAQDITVNPEKREGIYVIYPSQTLNIEYEYIKTVEMGPLVVKTFKASYLIGRLIDKAKKEGGKVDAILINEKNFLKADVVRFK